MITTTNKPDGKINGQLQLRALVWGAMQFPRYPGKVPNSANPIVLIRLAVPYAPMPVDVPIGHARLNALAFWVDTAK